MLSRIETIECEQINYEELAKLQETDEELNQILKSDHSSLQMNKINLPNSTANIYTAIYQQRIYGHLS